MPFVGRNIASASLDRSVQSSRAQEVRVLVGKALVDLSVFDFVRSMSIGCQGYLWFSSLIVLSSYWHMFVFSAHAALCSVIALCALARNTKPM